MKAIIIIAIGIFSLYSQTLYAQELSQVNCLTFDPDDEFIEVKVNEEVGLTTFSIIRKKYETEESREKAIQEYRDEILTGIPLPALNISYTSFDKPIKIMNIAEIGCDTLSSLEQARENEDLFSYRMIFLQNLQNGVYRKWNVRMWTY